MKRKKILAACLSAALSFTTVFSGLAFAGTESDLTKELQGLNKQLSQYQKLLNSGKQKDKQLTKQINEIEKSIKNAENQISKLTSNMQSTENEIARKTKELEAKQKEIDIKNDTMNQRLRVMYKNGDVGLLQIVLGSNNFTEFLSNIDIVRRIYQQDLDLIAYMKNDHAALKTEKVKLENLKSSLATQKKQVSEKQDALAENKEEYAEIRQDIRQDNKELAKQIDDLNRDAEALTSELRKLMGDQDYAGGTMMWPAPGYTKITSPFGNRLHPILKVYKMHTGVDIGVPRNNKIVAANDGIVIMAAWYGGYGNAVIIDHGGGIATLYAHNTSLKVKKGDKVKRGDQVAVSGSTGNSTGPHLHFEVRVNGSYKDPMPYLK